MRLFRLLLRKKQSKGHGIHSPFAFDIITNVLNSPYSYYAFTDIPDSFPYSKGETKKIKKFNHLSFRLVNHFKATNILEINPGNGFNTSYIKSPSSKINYKSISGKGSLVNAAEESTSGVGVVEVTSGETNKAEGSESDVSTTKKKYDAVFININGDKSCIPSIKWLLDISHENTFWVINPINKKHSKQFCQLIVNHESVTVSFDTNNTLVVFLRKSYHKHHYFV
jgi:hypothetical protein